MNKKITLICGRTFTVYKFRKNLVKALQDNNYDVSIIALDNDYEKQILEWNVDFYHIDQNNRSINPFEKISLLNKISKLLDQIKPDKVFTFMLTPNTFGVLAAHKSKIKDIYSMVEGAGDVFIYNTLKWKIIRFFTCSLYRKAFKYSKKIFFLNNDDKNEFIQRKLVKSEQCVVIPGIGVDTDYYAYKPIKNTNTFLMVARLMPSKGILEYCEAARLVKKIHPEAVFNLIGEEFTLTKKDIQEYIDDGSINYLGYVEDIRPYYENCLAIVSCSYREGMPMILLEAASVGRLIISTNSTGNREVVTDNVNGFLVNSHKPEAIAERLILVLNNTCDLLNYGEKSRKIVVEDYKEDKINKKIVKEINLL